MLGVILDSVERGIHCLFCNCRKTTDSLSCLGPGALGLGEVATHVVCGFVNWR